MVILFALIYMYFVLFEYLLGQTPGMMCLRIKIFSDGTLKTMLLRNMFIIPVFPIILLWIIEPIMIAARKRTMLEMLTDSRSLHEIILR
jgi:uncharacterized RDD family membrane protein YckC